MRVAHIGWLCSSHLRRRAEAFAAEGLDTLVITDRVPPGYDWRAKGLSVETLPAELACDPPAQAAWLDDLLVGRRVDLLHIHSTHFPAALGFFCKSVPRVTSIWDFVYSRDRVAPLFHRVILDELFKGTISEYVSFSSRVVMDKWLNRGFPAKRAFWHSWGVDRGCFRPVRDELKLSRVRRELGVEPGEKIIFSPRTTSLPANVDLVLQAMSRVGERVRARCIVTGHMIPQETRYYEALLKDERIRRHVTFIDPIRDKQALNLVYNAASAVVSLHSNDNNPATVLETMAAGSVPVIGESETVEYWVKDGGNGFVVRTRDLDDLTRCLVLALSLPEQTRRAWAGYNADKIAAEADFGRTLKQAVKDYGRMCADRKARIDYLRAPFYRGLLLDIAGRGEAALDEYLAACGSGCESAFLADLISEKRDLAVGEPGAERFHLARADQKVLDACLASRKDRASLVRDLEYPKSLFRHDFLAGMYPLVKQGRVEEFIDLVGMIARRFNTGRAEWLAESVNWFGRKWGMWDFCADLLGLCEDGGSSLAGYAVETARALGPGDLRREGLLKKALAWTEEPVTHIAGWLDEKFRREAREQCLDMLGDTDAARTAEIGVRT